jgi:hypothetical protein
MRNPGKNYSQTFVFYNTDSIKIDPCSNFCVAAYVPCRWIIFTLPLPSNNERNKNIKAIPVTGRGGL